MVEEKIVSTKMLIHEVEEWVVEAEHEFQQMKSCVDVMVKEVITSERKVKQATEWFHA